MRNLLLATISVIFLTMPTEADELAVYRQRLLAVRTHDEVEQVYNEIDRRFNGDTDKIINYLEIIGFSCLKSSGYLKARCVFAHCGDREVLLLFKRQLVTIEMWIREQRVITSVINQLSECPASSDLLVERQKSFLK